MPRPAKVISGGQTGVDRAALDAAVEAGIPVGGWCPKGRMAEDGPIPDRYPLRETSSASYPERTRRNIVASDGTLILLQKAGDLSGGTKLTRDIAAQDCGEDVAVVSLTDPGGFEQARLFLEALDLGPDGVLNVAGPRESKSPGIYNLALEFLRRLFKE